jgi:predicted DNA-binding ArsR family transcriptional regulator
MERKLNDLYESGSAEYLFTKLFDACPYSFKEELKDYVEQIHLKVESLKASMSNLQVALRKEQLFTMLLEKELKDYMFTEDRCSQL